MKKKILARQLILKNIHAMALKNSYKEFDNEKKFLRLENSPPPHNFSNGPSLIRCFTVTDVSQSTEYFLIISAKPELKLGQHLVDGRIVNVNILVVSLRHRRN